MLDAEQEPSPETPEASDPVEAVAKAHIMSRVVQAPHNSDDPDFADEWERLRLDGRDAGLDSYISEIPPPDTTEEAIAQRNAWIESALMFSTGEDYYRGLVDRIGAMLGDAAYIADDGSRSEDILCAKVPELVAARLAEPRHDAPKIANQQREFLSRQTESLIQRLAGAQMAAGLITLQGAGIFCDQELVKLNAGMRAIFEAGRLPDEPPKESEDGPAVSA